MDDETYEYPYGSAQTHEALADLDKRLKALEPKPVKKDKPADPVSAKSGETISTGIFASATDKPAV